ncbi:MAG: 2,4-dihydroxyhept-2-ene-1,7-dioic acid aldolase [Alphaproteobacteria bacterium]|nr:2,4-dihydroxyhept-2-ene-1,7-dioic acid aldolase [Alphaproteobacteria bacterium]
MMNDMRKALSEGKTVINGWQCIPSAFAGETLAGAGWDGITLDMQHGIMDYASVIQSMQAMARFPLTPTVRVPWNEPGMIGRVLDGGAMGIVCPMVNTEAEARALVRAVRFPPLGTRSHGPARAGSLYGSAGTYYKTANTDVLCIAMIETPEAVQNIDAIVNIEGLDGIYIGPGDLGLTMGLPPVLDRREPEILNIYEQLIAACRKAGKWAGIHNATSSYSIEMAHMGFQFLTILTDNGLLYNMAKSEVDKTRAGLPGV